MTHRSGTPHAAAGAQKPEAGDPLTTDTTFRSDERGIALVVTLFMVLILSVLGASLVFVSRTETISSLNYKTMSQTRYGAESGIHHAANHLLWAYVPSRHRGGARSVRPHDDAGAGRGERPPGRPVERS